MTDDLKNWTPRPKPERRALEGHYVRLEPLSAAHDEGLFAACTVPDADTRFRWLLGHPPQSRDAFQPWREQAEASSDPLFFAVIDKASGQVAGLQSFLRIDSMMGVIEIGHIYWGPLVSRTPAATEALFLFAAHAFDTLGYRRFEWKCHAGNAPSRKAAARFGFTHEGVFRQHMVFRGENRDTAWFSILDKEWPALKAGFQAWLDPGNFDGDGQQKKRLEDFR